MRRIAQFASHLFMSASFVLILLGALSLNRAAQASTHPVSPLVCACTGCGAKAADGSCPGSCSAGAGCISCYCSEVGSCPCSS